MADALIPALQTYFGVEHVVPAGRGALGIAAALRAWGGDAPNPAPVAVPAAV
jgi:hypothetical protein